jgi:hypothetical protein
MNDIVDIYSPNFEWGKTHVEIVLQQWDHRAVEVVEVGGNCHGFGVMETAIGVLLESLPGDERASIILTDPEGNRLHCEDDDDRQEEWLKDMVVSVRIIALTHPTLNEIRARNGAPPVEGGGVPRIPL